MQLYIPNSTQLVWKSLPIRNLCYSQVSLLEYRKRKTITSEVVELPAEETEAPIPTQEPEVSIEKSESDLYILVCILELYETAAQFCELSSSILFAECYRTVIN